MTYTSVNVRVCLLVTLRTVRKDSQNVSALLANNFGVHLRFVARCPLLLRLLLSYYQLATSSSSKERSF
jgi:hypothetical protein